MALVLGEDLLDDVAFVAETMVEIEVQGAVTFAHN